LSDLEQSVERQVWNSHLLFTHDKYSSRLRVKVNVPYETLQILVKRLHKFQQASDLLRRTSRFVTLARRLQNHMNEIQGVKTSQTGVGDGLATATVVHGKDIEDEKERAIAKAALIISELGKSQFIQHSL